MRRPARGGTTRPAHARPGNGYGRPLRPEPERLQSSRPWLDPEWWSAIELEPSPVHAEPVAEGASNFLR